LQGRARQGRADARSRLPCVECGRRLPEPGAARQPPRDGDDLSSLVTARRRGARGALVVGSSLVVLAATLGAPHVLPIVGIDSSGAALSGIHKIKHVVVIMQENRSFDSYFGTFPGANGIPMKDGQPTVCVPDPQ